MNGILVYRQNPITKREQQRLDLYADAFTKLNARVIAIPRMQLVRTMETTQKGFFKFALFLDEDTQIAKYLQENYQLQVYNSETAIHHALDKALLFIALRNQLVSTPQTIVLPHTMNVSVMERYNEVKDMLKDLPFPFLIKERNVQEDSKPYFVHDENECKNVLQQIGMRPLVAQAYISPLERKHYKILIIGKKVYGAVELYQEANASLMRAFQPPQNLKKIALQSRQAIGAEFCEVSMFTKPNKKIYVYAIKTNPDVVELQIVTGVFVAWYIARHVLDQTRKKSL
jgi:glutathione synthase/RimK-type ligase-like ATP-grasp enzyme